MIENKGRFSAIGNLFRSPPADGVSDRVRAIIRRQEALSEILIGWVQLALVLLFGLLFAISPAAHGSFMPEFEPVPFALAAYLAFTVFRLWLAYRRALPASVVYLSVFLDMALLMGLIYSFHLQYDQPPAFYLKAPTLLYVFIFIALRALRFDPRYVLTAGLAAAVGWLVLVGVAAAGAPMGQGDVAGSITRDYIAYLTSTRILIGAEVDKIVSILVVTLILTAALSRARQLLFLSAQESTAARDLGRFFSPAVAQAITGAEDALTAGQGQAREAAILLIDIRSFSAYAAGIPPDETIRVLAEYQTYMVPAIERHGGTIDKFMGDGIMATFGAVAPGERIAAQALAALEEVLHQADVWADRLADRDLPPLVINVAAAAGPVIVGAVGHADRLEYTVVGSAVNAAAKLEDHNKAAGSRALVSTATFRRALDEGFRPRLTWNALTGRELAGLQGRHDLMMVPGTSTPAAPATGAPPTPDHEATT